MKISDRRLKNLVLSCLRKRNESCLMLINLELTDGDLEKVLDLIKQSEAKYNKKGKIQSLNLSKNLLSNEACKLLKDAGFKNVNLDDNQIEDEGAYWLSKNSTMVSLSFKGNYILEHMRERFKMLREQNVPVAETNFGDLPDFPFSTSIQYRKRFWSSMNLFGQTAFLSIFVGLGSTLSFINSFDCENYPTSNNGPNFNNTTAGNNTLSSSGFDRKCHTNTHILLLGIFILLLGIPAYLYVRFIEKREKNKHFNQMNQQDCIKEGTNFDPAVLKAEKLDPRTLLSLPNPDPEDEVDRLLQALDNSSSNSCSSFLCCWKKVRLRSPNLQALAIQSANPASQNLMNAPLLLDYTNPSDGDERKSRTKSSSLALSTRTSIN